MYRKPKTLLALALALVLCLSGLGTIASAATLSAPGEFPIVDEKVEITVLMQNTAQVEDFATNEFTKWYEEKTNVHVNFELLPVVEGMTKLNLILSSGDYPEIIMNVTSMTTSQVMAYATQGIFQPLSAAIDAQGVELKDIFSREETAFLESYMTYPDGEIYYLPDINQCYHCSIPTKLWIYQPWLDALGLEMPTTLDEYTDVLRAFKEQDPNGNGKADEIGFATQWETTPGAIMNSFIYNDNSLSLLVGEDGTIDTSVNKDAWRDGLAYMNMMYEEGLIAAETFTMDWDQMKQLGENPDGAILGSSTGLHTGMFCQFYGESGRWLEYVIVPPLEGPDGFVTAAYNPYQAVPDTLITNKCEDVELAVKWVDGMYETEAVLRSIYGSPDVEWIWAEEGDIGIDGNPALYKLLVQWSETVQNVTWAQAGPQMRTNTFRMGETAKPEDPLETLLYQATLLMEPVVPAYEAIVPPQVFTDEQATELADIEKAVKDYVREMTAKFVLGDSAIETEWDLYVETLDALGLQRLLEINQEAYDLKSGN